MKHRLVISVILLTLAAVSISPAHFGAQYEPPDGNTYHGVGWQIQAQNAYCGMFPDSLQPLLHQSMHALPGYMRRGGMTVAGLLRGLAPDNFDAETQYPEISVHFGLEGEAADDVFANSDRYDNYIDTLATALGEYGRPVFLRIGGEMNGRWNGYHPYDFPRAFRKLVEGIRDIGVDNFASIWCYEPDAGSDFADSNRAGWKWYPGDDVVDWFGIDLFDADHFDPDEPDSAETRNGWEITKKGRTELFMRFADERGKPVYINELSARHVWITPYDDEVDSTNGEVDWDFWFAPFFEFLDNHPGVKAFNYINLDWTQYDQWERWGDARLQINEYIRDQWVEALSSERYIHSGYDIAQHASAPGETSAVPDEYDMVVYPNPFNSTLSVRFSLEHPSNVIISIFDINGRRMTDLANRGFSTGSHQIGRDVGKLSTGIYLIRMTTPEKSQTIKAAHIK